MTRRDSDRKDPIRPPGISSDDALSRRTWLGGAAIAIGAGASFLAPIRARAQQKVKQASVQYQTMPKGTSKCGRVHAVRGA